MPETLITLAIIVALFAWPPFLQLVCPPCGRLLRRLRPATVSTETAQSRMDDRTAA